MKFTEVPYYALEDFFLSSIITSSVSGTGELSPLGIHRYEYSTDQTYTFSASGYWKVNQVIVDNVNIPEAVSAGNYTFENIRNNHTIEIINIIPHYIIDSSVSGLGSISPSGSNSYEIGSNVMYIFAPSLHQTLTQLLVDGANQPSHISLGTYTFEDLEGNHTIEAIYELSTFSIAVRTVGSGAITPSVTQRYSYGSDQTFTFAPTSGGSISKAYIDGVNNLTALSAGEYTFTNITTAHTIRIEFTP